MSTLDAIYRVPTIPAVPTKVLATAFTECGGGMAANASVAIARLGGNAHYWGRVGDDPLGQRILADLAAEGVDVGTTRRLQGCTSPSSAILVAEGGERLVCAYNDPRFDADPTWLPLDHVADFAGVLADVRWPDGAAAVLDAARAAGRIAVLDGDVGPSEVLVELLGRATHAVFSEPGLTCLSGTATPGAGLAIVANAARGVVGVTLGGEGFLWRDGSRERLVPAFRVAPVDTLAAGDVWHGAFTLALAEGNTIDGAGRFANACAAIKCTRFGGRSGAPVRAEVVSMLGAEPFPRKIQS